MAKERKPAPTEREKNPTGRSPTQEGFRSGRELIVCARQEAGLRATREAPPTATRGDVTPLANLLSTQRATLRPLFGISEERVKDRAASLAAATGADVPDLSLYYGVEATDERLDELTDLLRGLEVVETAYLKPPAEPPMWIEEEPVTAITEEPPVHTADFSNRQAYLDAAPSGIDARYGWTIPGGGGASVGIIDIEGAWRFTHEDLLLNQGGVVGGNPTTDLAWRNHGTAVVGEFGGDRNAFGITGICPDANVRAVSIFGGLGSAAAIRQAADMLNPGDIILIELHRPGPRFNFQSRQDQRGYIAIEWWPDDFDAIRYATSRGVIVVEAAGNGAENLDDAIYNARPAGFPAGWTNPFDRANRDSGAIVVGAGAPPPGTHGRSHGLDRSRLGFSNFGTLIDAQGWGREVTTTGGRRYQPGDLQGGSNEDEWYTDQFSGTSSASPIVVGSLGCVQGILRARGTAPLTPDGARQLLRTTGSPQQDAPGRPSTQRIGNRPDLHQMIDRIQVPAAEGQLYRYWNPDIGDHFYTTNWNELGSGRYGWNYEGIQSYINTRPQTATIPLYRYWNPDIGDHFYTTNWNELGTGRYGWNYEGIQGYVSPQQQSGTAALYRYWNPDIGDHFYTTNWNELGTGRYGWNYEGVQCFVHTQPLAQPSIGEEIMTAAVISRAAASVPTSFRMAQELTPTETLETFTTKMPRASAVFASPSGSESFRTVGSDPTSFELKEVRHGKGVTISVALPQEVKQER